MNKCPTLLRGVIHSSDRMEVAGVVAVVLATVAAALCWSGRNSLSVLVGGVMGLANLRLWRGIVGGMVSGQAVAKRRLIVRFLLKGLLLAGFVWVVLQSPLAPWGVLVGFGSVLVGMVWAGVF